MLEYIKGEIVELTPASLIMDCNGLGYSINISLNTFTALQGIEKGKIYIYEVIREDAHLLFGFFDKRERALFLLLITVSGVGANTARMILSSLSISEVEQSISSGNVNLIKSVKGIGLKTAQRIIVDLKDKIKNTVSDNLSNAPLSGTDSFVKEEAVSALVTLGFTQVASQKVIEKILHNEPSFTVEQIIKAALRML